MASDGRQTSDHLIETLCAHPHRFDFFQALRRLQSHYKEAPRIGEAKRAKDDPFRFSQKVAFDFASAPIDAVRRDEKREQIQIVLRFMGLLGLNGPMPLHLTEHVFDRLNRSRDATLKHFLDIFHHRLASLFFKAWALNQQPVDFELGDRSRFGAYLGSLFGLGMDSLRNRDTVCDYAKLYYSGRLVQKTRNVEGLEAILRDYLQVTTRVTSFCGQWLDLPQDSRLRLGESPDTGTLGVNVIVGTQLWDCQLKVRIRLGPMSFAQFDRMLPGKSTFERIRSWVRIYAGDEYFWDLQLVLKKEEVPDLKLGQGACLGWTTYLKTKPLTEDADALILDPETH